jgi:hypothetical protein
MNTKTRHEKDTIGIQKYSRSANAPAKDPVGIQTRDLSVKSETINILDQIT